MKIFAHRGYSAKYPENTLAAFNAAATYNIDGIELDVHLSKDGHVVVIHDETVDRTTNGSGYVKDMTLEQLKQLDAGSKFHPLFKAEKIPTLEEVLHILKDTGLFINIELKTDIFPYSGLEDKVIELIKALRLEERIILSSFDHEILARAYIKAPELQIAPLFQDIIVNLTAYVKTLQTNAVHVSGYVMQRDPAMQAIKEGLQVRIYTINEKQHMEYAKRGGVEAIFTDEVEKAVEALKK